MKIIINLKDPDGVYDSLIEAGINPNKLGGLAIDKFITYLEYVSIEIDTETQTAKVLTNE